MEKLGQHYLDAGAAPKVAVGEIRSLNGLRGVAALAVAAYHGPQLFGVSHHLPHAYLAVDLFFVLSGFVMAHVYLGRITGGMALARFIQLRMARLYPLLALITLVGFSLWLLKVGAHKVPFSWRAFPDLAANLLLLPADSHSYTDHGDAYPFATQSWSIFWEIAACLSYYLWVRYVGRGELALAIFGAGLLCIVAANRGTIDGGWTYESFWVGGVRAFSGFWIGVIVRSLLGARIGHGAPTPLIIAASFGSAAMLAYVLLVPTTVWFVDYSIIILVFPSLIAAAAMSRSALFNNSLADGVGDFVNVRARRFT